MIYIKYIYWITCKKVKICTFQITNKIWLCSKCGKRCRSKRRYKKVSTSTMFFLTIFVFVCGFNTTNCFFSSCTLFGSLHNMRFKTILSQTMCCLICFNVSSMLSQIIPKPLENGGFVWKPEMKIVCLFATLNFLVSSSFIYGLERLPLP